ncbi:trehalose-phosphatase [archaeon]|nr:trehalose-phosphatase [archaeon]
MVPKKVFFTNGVGKHKEKELIDDYCKSKNRLIFLDYDGTLIRFFDRPEDAKPTDDILDVLEKLASDKKNELVIISGRARKTIDEWFDIDMSFVAGHGAWTKEGRGEWEKAKNLNDSDWKSKVRPIFEKYVETTPGSLIEEKDFSLAWHFRGVDSTTSHKRARTLVKELEFVHSMNLQLLDVSEVVEVMNAGVDKSTAALHWIEKPGWDFILAIGDDWTDENTFSVLPAAAYSIKVGPLPSQARFRMESPDMVMKFLKKLIEA